MDKTLAQQIAELTAERDQLASAVADATAARVAAEGKVAASDGMLAEVRAEVATLKKQAETDAKAALALAAERDQARTELANAQAAIARPDFRAALQPGVKPEDLPADAGAVTAAVSADTLAKQLSNETDPLKRAKLRAQIAAAK